MDQDITELHLIIEELSERYRIVRRDDAGRLREPTEALAIRQELDHRIAELKTLLDTSSVLNHSYRFSASSSAPDPRPAKLPNNMPQFKRPTGQSQHTVREFICSFERKLKAD
jgi:hypothetical protein